MLIILGLLAAEGRFLFLLLRQNGRLMLRLDAVEARLEAGGTAARAPAGPAPAQAAVRPPPPHPNGSRDAWATVPPPPPPSAKVGDPAPPLKLKDLDRKTFDLAARR